MEPYFPWGNAFYGRDVVREALRALVDEGRHTVLVAPRGFGKTSLMKKVIDDGRYPFVWLDFMMFSSKEEAESKLLLHLANLLVSLGKKEHTVRGGLKKHLKNLQPELSISADSPLKITFRTGSQHDQGVIEALLGVDALASEVGRQAVIVFDEFQEIAALDPKGVLQASIRHAAERSHHVTYLFSGSKHLALRRLLNHKQNPLYELCDQMTLSLIEGSYYRDYLKQESKLRWQEPLETAVVDCIVTLTECYPRYVNVLCSKLWRMKARPTLGDVEAVWLDYLYVRKAGIREALDALGVNEKRLLRVLSEFPTHQPFSQDFLVRSRLSQSSVRRALNRLQEKDLVGFVNEQYRVMDPTYKHYFEHFG